MIDNHWNWLIWQGFESISECLTKKVLKETKKRKLRVLIRLITANLSKNCILAYESH